MKFLSTSIAILFIGASCKHNKINCIRPYTEMEIAFVDSVTMASGTKVELERFNFPYSTDDSMHFCMGAMKNIYHLRIRGENHEIVADTDSMRKVSKMIALKLYNNVVTGEIIEGTREIEIQISSKPTKKHQKVGNLYSARIKKEDLEKANSRLEDVIIYKEYIHMDTHE